LRVEPVEDVVRRVLSADGPDSAMQQLVEVRITEYITGIDGGDHSFAKLLQFDDFVLGG
jgi:hypothetical protein